MQMSDAEEERGAPNSHPWTKSTNHRMSHTIYLKYEFEIGPTYPANRIGAMHPRKTNSSENGAATKFRNRIRSESGELGKIDAPDCLKVK